MIGRQVILTNRAFTLEELFVFLGKYWDTEKYCPFQIGRPTAVSIEEYILMPATERFMVIMYSRAAGGVFNKDNKVILCTANTPEGAVQSLMNSIPTRSIVSGILKTKRTMSLEKERKGPAEEILKVYAANMKELLDKAGYTK